MESRKIVNCLLVIGITMLSACNGGIGGTGGKEGGGGSNPDISVGAVTATGATEVNGVTFDTSTATITIDESASADTDLKEGMVVEIRGSIDSETTGSALSVVAEDVIKGMITNVLASNPNQVEIMGQLVEVDASTMLVVLGVPVPTLTDFTNNDLVEVSGFVKGNGVILATRIEEKASLVNFKLKGFIENTLGSTFAIGGQTIDFTTWPAVIDDLPGGVPVDGLLVEVKGLVYVNIGDSLVATRIELEIIRNSEGSQIELEGYITDATGAPGTFYIGSQQVQTNGGTIFKGGLAADIRFGIEVEAEGQISGGILIADEVEFESNTEVEADTMAVDALASTVTLAVGGLVVTTNADTEISTLSGAGNSLADLNAMGGNHLQVRGSYDAGSGVIVATRVEEKPLPDTDVVLQGPVTGKSMTTIEIMGVTVMPDPTAEYRDQNDVPVMDFNTFQALVSVGSIVKAESKENAPIKWEKLSLEF